MSDIATLDVDINSLLFRRLRELEFKYLVTNNTLVAGFKVRSKSGGPEMLVRGFLPDLRSYYLEDDEVRYKAGSWSYTQTCYEKIQLNTSNLLREEIFKHTPFKLNPGTDKAIHAFLFHKKIFDFEIDETCNSVIVVCKYWSDSTEKFEYTFSRLFELELIKD